MYSFFSLFFVVEKNKSLGTASGRKTLKEGKNPALEDDLFNWFVQQKEEGISPSQNELIARARELNQLNYGNDITWHPTKGWLSGFKERYGIKIEQLQQFRNRETQIVNAEKNSFQVALESAEFLLEFMDTQNFPLKEVITVRMIRDKIANSSNENHNF